MRPSDTLHIWMLSPDSIVLVLLAKQLSLILIKKRIYI